MAFAERLALARAVLRDRGSRWVLFGWGCFTLENVVMSEYRGEIKRAWGGRGGPGAYQNLYSTLSATCMASTFAAYWRFARHSLEMRPPTRSAQLAAIVWRAAGLVTISQLVPPINTTAGTIALGITAAPAETMSREARGALLCPFDFNAHKSRGEVFGVTRVTRRPELWGLAAVGIGGALLAPTAAGVCFFGVGPLVCFSALALHSDRTQRRGGELSPEKEAQTSVLPFVALLDGRQSWSALSNELVSANAGVAVSLALLAALRPSWMRWVR
eukprot:TRINITY_DN60014_c0_g1_i1.p2 TRINITY_DN60014_c0_g1~~TRINITY_DN60014_c0_g1_i1.p2  ORF type:complete len:291 (+),score=67.53 TRINITY_DN60014_c0_g1_i1:56-874(+)